MWGEAQNLASHGESGRKVLCALKGALKVTAVQSSGEDAARQGHSRRGKRPPGVAIGPALGCGVSREPSPRPDTNPSQEGAFGAEPMPPSTAVRRCVGSLREGAKGRVGGGWRASCSRAQTENLLIPVPAAVSSGRALRTLRHHLACTITGPHEPLRGQAYCPQSSTKETEAQRLNTLVEVRLQEGTVHLCLLLCDWVAL